MCLMLQKLNYCTCCWFMLVLLWCKLKHSQSVTQCFYSSVLCNKLSYTWVGVLERNWLITSVFLLTRCPNQLEISSLSPKPLTSSQQMVHSDFSWFIHLLCCLFFNLFLMIFLFPISPTHFYWNMGGKKPALFSRTFRSNYRVFS